MTVINSDFKLCVACYCTHQEKKTRGHEAKQGPQGFSSTPQSRSMEETKCIPRGRVKREGSASCPEPAWVPATGLENGRMQFSGVMRTELAKS